MLVNRMGVVIVAGALAIAIGCAAYLGAMRTETPAQAAPSHIASEDWPQPAPLLIGEPGDWLNTGGKPLQIENGKVYLIDYWEYTCVNCIRTLPYLKAWQDRYAKEGLVIIGVHTPEFAFARSKANVAAAVKRLGITWPVLVDSDNKNWDAWGNHYWPRKYFVDGKRKVVADHSGEGGYDQSEARIQKLLHEIHPQAKYPPVLNALRGEDKAGAVCYPTTPELYAGERGEQEGVHGNVTPYEAGATRLFADGGNHADGRIFLNGLWRMEPESVRSARAANGRDYVALKYHAIECNAVLKPEAGLPVRVDVTQDGRPVAKADVGADVRYDAIGTSYLIVDAPRMYSVTHNAAFGAHEIRLLPRAAGFGLYSYTFTSCAQ